MSPITRRAFLGVAAAALAAACSDSSGTSNDASGASTAAAPSTTAPPTTASPDAPAPPAGAGRFVPSGPTTAPRVALTFHTDGELALAAQILDILADHDTRMTSFIVGEWLDANPSWAARLTDAGHELANHTYTHPTFSTLTPDAMNEEIVRCRDVIVRLTGSGGTCFRPSGTPDGTTPPAETVLDLAGEAGYPSVLGFDVDPLDYDDPGPDAVAERTLAAVRPGSIISLHFGHPGTVTALSTILAGLDERGLQPVTASELLELP